MQQRTRILIIGGSGMLGRAVCRRLQTGYDLTAPTHAERDITDEAQMVRCLRRTAPAWVLHMAAMTDVDRCQQQPDLAFRTNGQATAALAAALAQLLQRGATCLYHVVNRGPSASRYDYACAIVAAAGLNVAVSVVTSDHFPQLAPRHALEAACSEKLPADHLPPWTQALDDYVKRSLERRQLLVYDRDLY